MGAPVWRGVFDRVERAVGAPLEQAVASSHFGTAVSLWVNANRTVDRAVRQRIDAQLAGVLHLLNIPTRGDVQRLSRQMATLTAEVRALSLPADRIASYVVELQDRGTPAVGPAATRQLTADRTAEDRPAVDEPAPATARKSRG
jgi:hypothetical protein